MHPSVLGRAIRRQDVQSGFLTDNIGIAYGTIIEDGVTGSGKDTLMGNDVGNRLDGGAGGDTYTGNGGADVFVISQKGFTDTITDFQSGGQARPQRAPYGRIACSRERE